MSAHEDVEAVGRDSWFVKGAGVVGDLGNPFYREERQRDVWNEASAVGLQVALWLGLGAAAAMVWLGGAPALPYAVAILVVLGAASWVSMLTPTSWVYAWTTRGACCCGWSRTASGRASSDSPPKARRT